MPEVTVLTAVRNGERYLPETIDSILNQTFQDWEYILVDDDSSDRTVEIVQNYQAKDNRIRLIQLSERKGPFGAANIGIHHSNGKYILRTDADDLSNPSRIEEQIRFIKANPSIRACASYGRLIDENSNETGYRFTYPKRPDVLAWFLCLHCPLIHSSLCIEKDAIIEIGGYKELPASQDYRMFTDISRKKWLSVVPLDLVRFRNHPFRLSNSSIINKQLSFTHDIIQDHIFGMSGVRWSKKEAGILYKFGLSESFSIRQGLNTAKRWVKLWRHDYGLSGVDKDILEGIYKEKRHRFMHKSAKKHPIDFLLHVAEYF